MAQRLLQLAEMQRAMGWERVFRDRTNPLDTFNDAELVKRYRFSHVGIKHITDIVALDIERETRRNFTVLCFWDIPNYCRRSLACITTTACSAISASLSRKINE